MEHTELVKQEEIYPGGQDASRLCVLGAEIRALQKQGEFYEREMVSCAVEIGRRLVEAKASVPHGEWGAWLERETDYSKSKAQDLMRVYRECGDEQSSLFGPSKAQALGNLSYTKVLMILTIPEGPDRDEFISATHVVNGEEKTVADMTTREMKALMKERDEAQKAAEQAKAEQSAAEQAREKIAQDMAFIKRQLEMAQEGQDEALDYAKKQQEAFDAADREVVRLAQELEALRARPVDVAVEVDAAAVEAARKEAEAAMRAKLDKAQRAKAKAEEARKAAENARAEAQQELERARAEADAIRAQAERAEKKAALAADADLVLFQELYEQVQNGINRMGGLRMKRQGKDPEGAGKLGNAIWALIGPVKEAAGK